MEFDLPAPLSNIFHCKTPDNASPAWWARFVVLIGAILGGYAWYKLDRTFNVVHIAGWIVGSTLFSAGMLWLLLRNPVLSIGIDEVGLTIVRANGRRKFDWAEVEAARFQDYNVGGQPITCFLLRAGGENFELTPDFVDHATRVAFEETILRELEVRDIPETSDGLPSFQRFLSLGGAWLFIVSVVAMLAAHAAGFHTLGTVFGLAFLLTGSIIAWMTRPERLSRLVLAATFVLIVGGGGILWACHINVRDVLQKWEQMEKR